MIFTLICAFLWASPALRERGELFEGGWVGWRRGRGWAGNGGEVQVAIFWDTVTVMTVCSGQIVCARSDCSEIENVNSPIQAHTLRQSAEYGRPRRDFASRQSHF